MIEPGTYRHYKGKEYEVIGVARHSETMEDLVVYKALYGDHDLWVRPARMFLEIFATGIKMVRRFEKVRDWNYGSPSPYSVPYDKKEFLFKDGSIVVGKHTRVVAEPAIVTNNDDPGLAPMTIYYDAAIAWRLIE